MEVGYNSIFVKKYSRGNSYAIEHDVENKRYKIKFINHYSIWMVFILLLLGLIVSSVFLIFSFKPIKKEFRTKKLAKKPNRPKNVVLFHEDKDFQCTEGFCKTYEERKKDYFERLEVALKKEGYDLLEIDDIDCGTKNYDSITRLELDTIVKYLLARYILLEESFEVPTIVKFKQYIKKFKRKYSYAEEYQRKYINFRKNRIFIETHNSDPDRMFTMGYNQGADVNENDLDLPILDQFSLGYMDDGMTRAGSEKEDRFNESGIIFDWRKHGHVVPVRDQGKCGTCWAFASADLVSSMVSIKINVLKTYSIQQLADCILPFYGCDSGGLPIIALDYIRRYNYCTEEEYPYKMTDYACIQPNVCKDKVQIKDILSLKNTTLENYIENKGPFIYIMHVSREFMFYKEGIFDGECGKLSNHAVVVVGHGYDKVKKVNYWIVKNSWTENWGEDGYFRIINAEEVIRGKRSYYCKMDARATGISLK